MNNWAEKWDDNYKAEDFIYGKTPNLFFKQELDKLSPSSLLLAAEGEGRNAIYAAKNNWDVSAFDISQEGRRKALKFAEENKVNLNYQVGELPHLDFKEKYFDALGLIYSHFPPSIRADCHRRLSSLLKKGGTIIFEGFSKKHLEYRTQNPKVGGPANLDFLFSEEEIKTDFRDFEFEYFQEEEIELSEGLLHNGTGHVIRFIAKKL